MKAYTLGLYEKAMPRVLTWQEKLLIAKEVGFDFLEISVDETDEKLARLEMTKPERLELLTLSREIGISIDTMCLSGHRKYPLGSSDLRICEKGMEIMEKAIDLAKDLSVRIIQLAGYDVYYEESNPETKKRFMGNLKKSVSLAAKAGVILGFETMETDFMNTVEKAMKYVTLVDSPYLKVYPDIGNLTNAAITYKNDVLEDLILGRGNVVAMHLKETVPGIYREVPYGTGHVDFPTAISCAWNMGVRKFVTEFWDTGNPDWKDDLYFAYDIFTSLLEEKTHEADFLHSTIAF